METNWSATVALFTRDGNSFLETSSGIRVLCGDGGVVRVSGLLTILAGFTHRNIVVLDFTQAQTRGSQISSHSELFD